MATGKRFDPWQPRYYSSLPFFPQILQLMGKQYDKVIKRRRRANYLERRKVKAKLAAASASKPRVRKPAAPARKAAVPAARPADAAPEVVEVDGHGRSGKRPRKNAAGVIHLPPARAGGA